MTALVAVALVVLTLVGAGLYALVPLVGSPEEDAVEAVESYVTAWAEKRCEDAAELIDGPRAEILAACDDDVETEALEIRTTKVQLDGDRGTATLQVSYRENGEPKVRDIVEELIRVDGEWKVAWRRR